MLGWSFSSEEENNKDSHVVVWRPLLFFFYFYPSQTFEAKLLHIESRPGRKSKNSTTELEFFMKCEVHSSDLDVFINSLKRVADDVRSIPEEKGFWHLMLFFSIIKISYGRTLIKLQALLNHLMLLLGFLYDNNMQPITKALINLCFFSLPSTSQFPGFPDRWKTSTDATCW